MTTPKGAERRPLAPGTKIRFVGPVYWEAGDAGWKTNPEPAKVLSFDETTDQLKVDVSGFVCRVHRRQVTHVLVPRQPKEKEKGQRRKWIVRGFSGLNDPAPLACCGSLEPRGHVSPPDYGATMIELEDGEVPVSRKQLADAWTNFCGWSNSIVRRERFVNFCASLGITKEEK